MTLSVVIASDDRDDVFAEIWNDDIHLAEIARGPDKSFVLTIFSNAQVKEQSFELKAFVATLLEASSKI